MTSGLKIGQQRNLGGETIYAERQAQSVIDSGVAILRYTRHILQPHEDRELSVIHIKIDHENPSARFDAVRSSTTCEKPKILS